MVISLSSGDRIPGGIDRKGSVSGIEMKLIAYPPPRFVGESAKASVSPISLGSIKTITLSTIRTVSAVRRLGESFVSAYTRGGRTVAGTMIFLTIDREAFSDIYYRGKSEAVEDGFMMVDQIPPLTVIMSGLNEYGKSYRGSINNLTLVGMGTSYSVDDIYSEQSYTYVAQSYTPIMPAEEHELRNSQVLARERQGPGRLRTISGD